MFQPFENVAARVHGDHDLGGSNEHCCTQPRQHRGLLLAVAKRQDEEAARDSSQGGRQGLVVVGRLGVGKLMGVT